MEECMRCIYYRFGFGVCMRYPDPVNKEPDDYCGEFTSKTQLLNEDHDYNEQN